MLDALLDQRAPRLSMDAESQRDMPVVDLPPYRVRDLPVIGEDDGGLVRELLSRAMTAVKTSSGLILNTFNALERRELEGLRRDTAVPVFDIGALRELRQPGLDEPTGPGGDGVGNRRQRRAVPLGGPSRPRPRVHA